jgi:hypothetical protein
MKVLCKRDYESLMGTSLNRMEKTVSEAVILVHPNLMFNVDDVCVGVQQIWYLQH